MFNRNENDGIIRNIKILKDYVDEIVIVDSSDPSKYEELKKALEKEGLSNKVKLLRFFPTGHVEPAFAYGIQHVSSDRIIRLDADEEPTEWFIEAIKKIKEGSFNYPVYNVALIDEEGINIVYKPMVVFRKDAIKRITGIIHTGIEFNFKAKDLIKDAYVEHHEKKPTRGAISKNYLEIETYERPIEVVIEYLKEEDGFLGRLISFTYNYLPKPLNRYLTATIVGLSSGKYYIVQSPPHPTLSNIKYFNAVLKYFESLPKEEQELRTQIAREMKEAGGVIKYLGLDDEKRVERLTATVDWNKRGLENFIGLILYRHFTGKPADDFSEVEGFLSYKVKIHPKNENKDLQKREIQSHLREEEKNSNKPDKLNVS
jgi:glycosyltransferase involved in cell wall biosynthesis